MPSCYICKDLFPTIPLLCKHFQIKHATHDFIEYICVEGDCNRSFHLLNSFKKHLKMHVSHTLLSIVKENSNVNVSAENNISSVNSSGCFVNLSPMGIEMPSTSDTLADNYIGKFLASLYSNAQIPRNVIQLVIEGIKNSLVNSNLIIPPYISNHINSVFQDIDNTFLNLNTEYKRIKYYTEKGTYIPPQEYIVGERLNDNSNNNTFSIIPTNCTA